MSSSVFLTAPEETDQIARKRNWLRHNKEPRHEIRANMADTRQSRLHWIHGEEQPGIGDVLKAYPRYGDPDGHTWVSCNCVLHRCRLIGVGGIGIVIIIYWHWIFSHAALQIDEDFGLLFKEEAANFTANWDVVAPKVLDLVKKDSKDDSVCHILEELHNRSKTPGVNLQGDEMNEEYSPSEGKDRSNYASVHETVLQSSIPYCSKWMFFYPAEEVAVTALVMLPILLPSRPVTGRKGQRKWKPSVAESRRAFIDIQKVYCMLHKLSSHCSVYIDCSVLLFALVLQESCDMSWLFVEVVGKQLFFIAAWDWHSCLYWTEDSRMSPERSHQAATGLDPWGYGDVCHTVFRFVRVCCIRNRLSGESSRYLLQGFFCF